MTPEQIDTMLEMHRYLMVCEIRYAFDRFCAENGDKDYRTSNLQKAFNDTKWEEFAQWFKSVKEND